MTRLRLNDGREIPQVGLGVFQVPSEDTARVVSEALAAGYRHVDTASAYGNEREVGQGLRDAGLPRDEVWVTTKVWNNEHGRDATRAACKRSLQLLDLEHLDLYLIHWPAPAQDRYVETWEALIELRDEGLARSIGVSNFHAEHLDRVIEATGVTPAVNQIELHPRLAQAELRARHAELGIVTEAWSPLAKGGELLDDPIVREVAEAAGRTPAQVVLRWHIQLGNVVIPKSVRAERMRENLDVLDWELSREGMAAIDGLERGGRTGPHPDSFD